MYVPFLITFCCVLIHVTIRKRNVQANRIVQNKFVCYYKASHAVDLSYVNTMFDTFPWKTCIQGKLLYTCPLYTRIRYLPQTQTKKNNHNLLQHTYVLVLHVCHVRYHVQRSIHS
jgi:hypothetical protein